MNALAVSTPSLFPSWRIALFARVWPGLKLMVLAVGIWQDGAKRTNPLPVGKTTVMLRLKALAVEGTLHFPRSKKSRSPFEANEGPPIGTPAVPRVSTTRQGDMVLNLGAAGGVGQVP